MRKRRYKLAIIGTGFAGLSCLATLSKFKNLIQDVVIISKMPFGSIYGSGLVDFLKDPFNPSPFYAIKTQKIIINQFIKDYPNTIFSKIINNYKRIYSFIDDYYQAVQNFNEFIDNEWLRFYYEEGKNSTFCLINGTSKQSSLYPYSYKNGKLEELVKATNIMIVNFNNYLNLHPEYFINSICYWTGKKIKAKYKEIVIEGIVNDLILDSDLDYAHLFDSNQVIDELLSKLEVLLKGENSKFTHIGFPPILGINKSEEIIKEIEERFEVKVFEIVPNSNSIVLYRLSKVLESTLVKFRGNFILGEVVSFEEDGREVRAIKYRDKRGVEDYIEADFVILAPGKFLHNFIIQKDGKITSKIPGIPIKLYGEDINIKNYFYHIGWRYDLHKLFFIGVPINEKFYIQVNGETRYKNVKVIGDAINYELLMPFPAGMAIYMGYYVIKDLIKNGY